jgi:hypothetical protein
MNMPYVYIHIIMHMKYQIIWKIKEFANLNVNVFSSLFSSLRFLHWTPRFELPKYMTCCVRRKLTLNVSYKISSTSLTWLGR